MKRVLTAVVLIPLVLVAVFRAPLWLFAAIVAAIVLLTLREYLDIVEAAGIKPFRWLTYVIALLPFVSWYTGGRLVERQFSTFSVDLFFIPGLGMALPALAVVFGVPLIFRKDLRQGLAASAASVFGTIYIAISLALLISLRGDPSTKILVVFVLFSVWAGDIAAYYAGRGFGRHKLAPIVSPNKTWEGAVASVIASIGFAILVFHWDRRINSLFAVLPWSGHATWMHVLSLGCITNIAAQLGDLFESALKRGSNVKDSGALLPGHGGFLDRIDALLFAIPAVWYYARLTGFLDPRIF